MKAAPSAILMVSGVLLWGSSLPAQPAPSPAPGPRIAVEPADFDFGKVVQKRRVTKEFRIRNFGAADLVIEKITATCNCTEARVESKVVKPGQSTALNVSFDTRSTPGPVEGNIAIRSNDPTQGTVEVKIRATVTGPRS
jgi:uncharacterized protein DUF1573